MRSDGRMGRSLLQQRCNPEDGDSADDNWSQILRPWLKDKLYKVGSVIKGYDRFAEEEGDSPARDEEAEHFASERWAAPKNPFKDAKRKSRARGRGGRK